MGRLGEEWTKRKILVYGRKEEFQRAYVWEKGD